MGQALKVIKFDSDENQDDVSFNGKTSHISLVSAIIPLRVAAIITAVLGIISLVLEVHIYFQFRYEIYLARLFPTLVSLITLTLLQSRFGRKNHILLTHIYLLTIFVSISFVSYKLPNLFGFNIIGSVLFTLTFSLFLFWGKKNQIIASIYFTVLFCTAALSIDSYALKNENLILLIPATLLILVISVLASDLRTRLEKNRSTRIDSPKGRFTEYQSVKGEFFSNSVVPLFKCDLKGNFEFMNNSFRELLELSDENENFQLNLFNDIIRNDKVKNHFLKKMENKGKVEGYRFKYEDRNGSEEVYLMDCKSSVENEMVYIEGSLRNITKHYKTDKALRKEIEILQKTKRANPKIVPSYASSTNRKTTVISRMGHELRTPMNSVLGFLTLIEKGLFENEEELQEFSHSAKLSAESLLGLINDVVEIAKIQDGSVEIDNSEYDLREEIDKLVTELQPHLQQKQLEFVIEIDSDIPQIVILDKSKYLQILLNLLRNAINISENGKIKILIQQKNLSEGKISLITSVEDSSEGLEDSELEKLLNNNEKMDKGSKITSSILHLMICKELVSLLDGKISASSEIGVGNKFTFELEIESIKSTDESEYSDGMSGKTIRNIKAKLLLVEDNPISRKVEQKLLHEAGYEVDSVDTATKAIEAVSNGSYDLVLMDIELKDMNGLEATKQIRELPESINSIPIIAVTAHSSMKDREKCLIAGMNDYISKPINITFLKMTIDQWLNEAKIN